MNLRTHNKTIPVRVLPPITQGKVNMFLYQFFCIVICVNADKKKTM